MKSPDGKSIRFELYGKDSPMTCKAFLKALPFEGKAVQARQAGEEIWLPEGPELNIPPENATVHLKPGELGIAPIYERNQVARSIAILYGEGSLHDCVNLFAKVKKEDMQTLKELGEKIWLEGSRNLRFELSE